MNAHLRAESAIEVEHLTVRYDRTLALDDLNLSIPAGALVGVLGPNGSGKSSLLKALVGAVPYRGTARILGVTGRRAVLSTAYVPQQNAVDLDFPVTVTDVARQGRYASLGPFRRMSAADHAAVAGALARVGIEDLADRQIGALSGGQRQRAFVARALAQDKRILLLDEPFAGVDATTETRIVDVLRELRDEGRTVVVVHHDLSTAERYFDHLVLLRTRLVASGPPAETFTPDLLRDAYGGAVAVFDLAAP